MSRVTMYVGRPIRRTEDPRLLAGEGRYLDDLRTGPLHHVAFVRSPHARARIRRLDLARARGMPGVVAILGPVEVAGRIGPIPVTVDSADYHAPPQPVLPLEVRAAGEPVAVVVARDPALALDAAERVEVDYEPLPAVATIDAALAPGAPRVHEDLRDNVLYSTAQRFGDIEGVLAEAEVTVRARLRFGRVTAVPLEPRGCLAMPDPEGATMTIWASSQAPHLLRAAVAAALGLPPSALRVRVPDVGGAFGVKIPTYPEEVLVAYAAWTLRIPVKWVQRRTEDLQGSAQCREQLFELELAARASGDFLALRARILTNNGAYGASPYGAILQPTGAARALPGPYRYRAFGCDAVAVATNTSPAGAYRGVAQPTAVLARERLIDQLARRLGRDPADLRLQNLLSPEEMAHGAINGARFENASFRACLEAALARSGYERFRREQAAGRRAETGIGIALFAEATGLGSANWQRLGLRGIPGFETARIRVMPDGVVEVASSIPAIGQGHETALAQVVADELAVDLHRVRVRGADTSATAEGTGVFASRGTIAGAGSAILAARKVRDRICQVAAALLECDPADVVLHRERAHPVGAPARAVTLAEVARAADSTAPPPRGADGESGLEATALYDPPPVTFANGCHVAVVRVERETGRIEVLRNVLVHDCGRVVNPMLVEGQVDGAVVQGLGNVLNEELVHDGQGQLLTATLMDYPLPRAGDYPPSELLHLESPSPTTIGGFKGVGETGVIGVGAAVANALADAVPEIAAHISELPLTPERVWRLLRARAPVDARGGALADQGRCP